MIKLKVLHLNRDSPPPWPSLNSGSAEPILFAVTKILLSMTNGTRLDGLAIHSLFNDLKFVLLVSSLNNLKHFNNELLQILVASSFVRCSPKFSPVITSALERQVLRQCFLLEYGCSTLRQGILEILLYIYCTMLISFIIYI